MQQSNDFFLTPLEMARAARISLATWRRRWRHHPEVEKALIWLCRSDPACSEFALARHPGPGLAPQAMSADDAVAENLLVRIEQEHAAINAAISTALDHAVECGRLLIEAKSGLPHGAWLPWVEANLSFGARQAQKYMQLAETKCEL